MNEPRPKLPSALSRKCIWKLDTAWALADIWRENMVHTGPHSKLLHNTTGGKNANKLAQYTPIEFPSRMVYHYFLQTELRKLWCPFKYHRNRREVGFLGFDTLCVFVFMCVCECVWHPILAGQPNTLSYLSQVPINPSQPRPWSWGTMSLMEPVKSDLSAYLCIYRKHSL